jgi:lysophospholipase L1-like esterase
MNFSHVLQTLVAFLALLVCPLTAAEPEQRPTLFLIGDSTVRNNTRGQMGWGTPLAECFDAARIKVENRALGGRSSRSYLREGLWDAVLKDIKAGDFVMMQFGHNDGGPIDEGKARASLKGSGEETREVTIKETGKSETVQTYGGYMGRYIADAKSKGATVIVCSLVPRNMWKDQTVIRASDSYAKWAREVAEKEGVFFLDLNELVARAYDNLGPQKVLSDFFAVEDHTHTNAAGARFTAQRVAEGLRGLKGCALADFLVPPSSPAAK